MQKGQAWLGLHLISVSAAVHCLRGDSVAGHSPMIMRDVKDTLRALVRIAYDGRVHQCISDYGAKKILGDVNESSLYEVWHGLGQTK